MPMLGLIGAQSPAVGCVPKAVIGVSLSSKTGWFQQSKISSYFNTYGTLCGTSAYPPDAECVVGKGP
jgi:hypothetical protein